MAVLDTSFLIAVERDRDWAVDLYVDLEAARAPLRIPAAVWVEYLYKLSPSNRSRAVHELERATIFEPFTRVLADEAARLQHELAREGAVLGWHDLQVATTALSYDEPLATRDAAFDRVAGLEVRCP